MELDAEVLERLSEYVAEFVADFGLITRRYWAEVYLQGLLLDGERKSIQPLAQRVTVPGWHGDTMQALQQFVNQSAWDEQAVLRTYRQLLAASLADPAGSDRHRRHRLCQEGPSLGGCGAPVLRHAGQDRQLPGGGLAALLSRRGRLPAGAAAVPAGGVDQPA